MKEVSFTNHIGQTFTVGEEVIMIALARAGRKITRVGTYLGSNNQGPVCSWKSRKMAYCVDGKPVKWKLVGGPDGVWTRIECFTKSTLPNGKVYKMNTTIAEVFL